MYTVKAVVNKATSIFDVECITIAKPGSDQWSDAMQLLKEGKDDNAKGDVDFILYRAPEFADEQMTEVFYEGHNIIVHRGVSAMSSPFAVAIYDGDDEREVHYQFVYPGDELYVMNEHGSTVEAVRRLN